MTTRSLRSSTLAHVTATLALVVSLGGGAYAAGLAKDSVKTKHIRAGAVRTADLADRSVTGSKVVDGSMTGADVADGSLTGADIDESTLVLPSGPALPPSSSVHRSPKVAGKLSEFSYKVTEVEVTLPADGFVDVVASATFNGAQGSQVIDAFVTLVSTEVARGYWDAGDADFQLDMHQAAHGVIPIKAGKHTFKLFMGEYVSGTDYSSFVDAQIIVRYFPQGSVT
jgi:hypothetical protein